MSRLELPKGVDGWDWTPITEVAGTITDFVSNGSFASLRENVTYKRDPDHAILLRVADYSKGFTGPFVYVDEEAYKFLKKSSLHPGDIVVGNVGSIGTAFETPDLGQPITIGPNALLVRPKLPNRFLYFLIQSPLFQEHLQRISSKIAQPKFNKTQFRSIEVPMPPEAEQRRIAHVLGTVQQAIEQQERLIRSTTELKQALMQKLFTEGLRGEAQKETEIGPVPESWEVVKLESLADVRGGKRLPKGNALVSMDTGYPYIRVTDFKDNSVATEQVLFVPTDIQPTIKRYIIERDDIYISVAGSIGIVGMVPEELNGANLTENANRLVVTDKRRVLPRYLMYWLDTESCQTEIKAQTLKNAQPKLGLGRIKTLPVALPTISEQEDIVHALDAVRQKRQVAERKRNALQDLFRTLLHELMTGKVRVGETIATHA